MDILILMQGRFGGTDLLLKRLSSWLEGAGKTIIKEEELHKGILIDLLILPTSEMYKVFYLLLKGVRFKKVLVWSLGDGAFSGAFYNRGFLKQSKKTLKKALDILIRYILKQMMKEGVIVFSDFVALNNELGNLSIGARLSPGEMIVPIAIKKTNLPLRLNNSSKFNIAWVGRVSSDFKILPLIKLLNDLQSQNLLTGVIESFLVIGDGDASSILDAHISSLRKNGLSFKIDRIKYVDDSKLCIFLNENIDLLFAMGTSVLDGARSGVPSVIVLPKSSLENLPTDEENYRWVFDSVGYSLGEFEPFTTPAQKNVDIGTILKNFRTEREHLAFKSKSFTEDFEEDNVFGRLIIRAKGEISVGIKISFFLISLFYVFKRFLKSAIRRLSGSCKRL